MVFAYVAYQLTVSYRPKFSCHTHLPKVKQMEVKIVISAHEYIRNIYVYISLDKINKRLVYTVAADDVKYQKPFICTFVIICLDLHVCIIV